MSAQGCCASCIQTAGLFSFPWSTAAFQDTHDLASPAPPEDTGGAGAPPTPGFQSFSRPCVSGFPWMLLCLGPCAQLHWGAPLGLGSVFPSRPGGSLSLQNQIDRQLVSGRRLGTTACSGLGNLLMFVLNPPHWFSLKSVVLVSHIPIPTGQVWGDSRARRHMPFRPPGTEGSVGEDILGILCPHLTKQLWENLADGLCKIL